MKTRIRKIGTVGTTAQMRVIPGHFATNHAHINYYLDLTMLKSRTSEAKAIAKVMAGLYLYDTIVDTIVCMEGMEVIGAFLSDELAKGGFMSMNRHKSIYVVRPEFNNNSQIIFRDNLVHMIEDKHVLVLVSSATTGLTVNKVIESILYYNGIMTGVSAIFGAVEEVDGVPIKAVFGKKDLPDYESYDYRDCPLCKQKQKLDALVNAFGYSAL